jgi:succinate dehydrogenase hydrophobic anchor subunit
VSGAPRSRQPRPVGKGRELIFWLLTRYSAVALFVLALAHFSMTHFIYDPANQTAEWITQMRWNSLAVRLLDWSMLFIVLVHSFLGMRTVVKDYLKGGVQDIVLTLVWILAAALVVLGSNVVLTLPLK